MSQWGRISLAIIPFCRAGTSKGVPEKFRQQWSLHPLHENRPLVEYLRVGVAAGRFEAMQHGYYHDEPDGRPEFVRRPNLSQRVADGRKYLEDLLGIAIRVFVPPHNSIERHGLRAIAQQGLHLGGVAGVRGGWSPVSPATWRVWLRLRRWRKRGGLGIPWVLDLGDHREIAGYPVTPSSRLEHNEALMTQAQAVDGVFCAATHHWEFDRPSAYVGEPTVREHLQHLVDRVRSDPLIDWRSVGDIVSDDTLVA
jgi:hypothetical protein